jgi:hypothetical protein
MLDYTGLAHHMIDSLNLLVNLQATDNCTIIVGSGQKHDCNKSRTLQLVNVHFEGVLVVKGLA